MNFSSLEKITLKEDMLKGLGSEHTPVTDVMYQIQQREQIFYRRIFSMHKQERPNLQRMSSMKTKLINYNLCSYVIIVKRGQQY